MKVRVRYVFQHGYNVPGVVEVPDGWLPETYLEQALRDGKILIDVSNPNIPRLVNTRNLIMMDVQGEITDGE